MEPPAQSAQGTAIAQAYGEGATASVVIVGITGEELQRVLRAAGEAQQAVIDNLSGQLHTTREAVRGFFNILSISEVPVEELPRKLEEVAQRHRAMLQRISVLDSGDPEIRAYVEQAHDLLTKADTFEVYDQADILLEKAEEVDLSGARAAEALSIEATEIAKKKRLRAAAIRAERGELSLTRQEYLAAGRHFRAAAVIVDQTDSTLRVLYLNRYAEALIRFGDYRGDSTILAEAVSVCRSTLGQIPRDEKGLIRSTQTILGTALQTLGRRESGVERLEEAVSALREALKNVTREESPLEWGVIQMNLCNTFLLLGERQSDAERLEEAIAAYREASKELTLEKAPTEWAATHSNLGGALVALGERESGTKRLEEAIAAFQEALKVQSRERSPLSWALTQNNLGNALAILGKRESGTKRLEEAVIAFQEALKERTRERVPLQWAMTKRNLGNVLRVLGERENGTTRLKEAETALREALQERTHERVPLDWAATQAALGATLITLDLRESGTKRLEEAIAAFQEALKVQTKDGVPFHWAITQNNLGNALGLLGQRETGTEALENAIVAYDCALSVFEAKSLPQANGCRAIRAMTLLLLNQRNRKA